MVLRVSTLQRKGTAEAHGVVPEVASEQPREGYQQHGVVCSPANTRAAAQHRYKTREE